MDNSVASQTTKPKDDLCVITENERREWEMRETVSLLQRTETPVIQLREDTELPLTPLPEPKPFVVPDEVNECFGDILMVTEFLHCYGTCVIADQSIKINPDHLIAAVMSSGQESNVFYDVLIAFVNILLKNLNENKQSKKLSELNVGLIDIHLTKDNIGEVTKLYLKNDHDELSMVNEDEEQNHAVKLSPNILTDLDEKEIIELRPAEKIQVLAYLLENVLQSDYFYCNIWDMQNKKRKEKVQQVRVLGREIRKLKELKNEKLKEKDTIKNAQKEIEMFMVKDQISDKMNDQVPPKVEQERSSPEGKMTDDENDDADDFVQLIKEVDHKKKESKDSKTEEEKEQEIRHLSEELYKKTGELKILKNSWKGEGDTSRQTKLIGLDRHYSRYWLVPGYYIGLFVEKLPAGENGSSEHDDDEILDEMCETHPSTDSDQKCSWYYYDNIYRIRNLIEVLSPFGERESVLRTKLNTQFRSRAKKEKKDFERRSTIQMSAIQEDTKKEPLESLKEELIDLGSRLTKGRMSDMEEFESWVENVNNCSSTSEVMLHVVILGSTVPIRKLSKSLKKPEKWLDEQWTPSVQNAKTLSRMHLCINILDCCIRWDECTFYMKCKICRKSGGTEPMVLCDLCQKGYHTGCLRPALEEIPEEWQCPCCKPPENRRATLRHQEEHEHGEEGSEASDVGEHHNTRNKQAHQTSCALCRQKGDLIHCDYCPRVFHRACHDPPLRRLPRSPWKCCRCNSKPLGLIAGGPSDDSGSDVDYSETISDDVITKTWTNGRNKRSRKRKWRLPTREQDEMDGHYEESSDEEQQEGEPGSGKEQGSEEEEDENEDYCNVCGGEGDLVCCDECPKVYHKECHNPPLRNVPRGTWKCSNCEKPTRASRKVQEKSKTKTKRRTCIEDINKNERKSRSTRSRNNEMIGKYQDYSEEEEEEQESSSAEEESEEEEDKSEDYCTVCGEEGDLVCCDECPKVYHKECHNPLLRNVPRGAWKCSSCQKPSRGSRKRHADVSLEEKSKPKTKRKPCIEAVKKNEPSTRSTRSDEKASRISRKRKSDVLTPENDVENGGKRNSRQNPEMRKCELLLKSLTKHEDSWPFLHPVNLAEVPDYLKIVVTPMDFETIKNKLDALEYSGYKGFLNDVQLVFSNSNKYNMDTSDHGLAGESLSSYFQKILPSYFPDYDVSRQRSASRRKNS